MSFELDIHAVGKGHSSGDAITLRFGILGTPQQKVVVIDGGYHEDGEVLLDFIQRFYGTRTIDLMVSTHPHNDHVGGLRPILESLDVRKLWMHRPWTLSRSIRTYITDGRVTHCSLTDRLQQSFKQAHELEQLAKVKGILVEEPFAGMTFEDTIRVAGPTKDYYASLMASFDADQRASPVKLLVRGLRAASEWFAESWDKEALVEPNDDAVSPVNNSSTVLYLDLKKRILLTSDAGTPALQGALDFLTHEQLSIDFSWVQLPHHGSKRNIGPSVLNRLLGPPFCAESSKWGIASAAKEGRPKHPSQRVVNAVRRRGAKAQSTSGRSILLYSSDIQPRPGFGPLATLEFVPEYED